MLRLAQFEIQTVQDLFGNEWGKATDTDRPELHYFGVGTGVALKGVANIANANSHKVVAYETCSIGYLNAEEALERKTGEVNAVRHADMCFACKRRYIRPDRARKLIASRVLDVLDTQENGYEKKPTHLRKTPRTAKRLGRLLRFLDVLLIHPCKDDNPHAIWGDSTPYSIEEIAEYMRAGLRSSPRVEKLGKISFHGNIYTAVLFKRNEA